MRLLAPLLAAVLLLGCLPSGSAYALESDQEPAAATDEAPAKESVDAPLPTIYREEADLPAPVRDKRLKLMEAARSGDMEQLRALMQAEPEAPAVAFGDPGDPIEYLKALAADAEGREILAILLEVLESG
jgi:hypothetical protein